MHPPFASVWFDCDSTLCAIEGVDELLQFAQKSLREDIAVLTREAMEGRLPLAAVYESRLRLLAPSQEQITAIGELYVLRMVQDAHAVIAALQFLGKQIGIISGGLLPPVQRVAAALGIEKACVHAVPIEFAADGSYRDFDKSSPLWRNGGKVEVLRALPKSSRPIAFIGDGATDLETQGTADLFIGFGGVAVRQTVKANAQAYFATPSLAPLLTFVLTAEERSRLQNEHRFADLLTRSIL